jgi:dienelactone hydrolase
MLTQHPFLLENSLGWPIRGRVRWLDGTPAAERPAVVICHGFKGFQDWGMFPWVADELARAGFRVVTFNFGGSGIDEVPDQFTRLDRFRRNTLSLEVEELDVVLAALARADLPGGAAGTRRIGLLGHSRGAVATSVVACRNRAVGALAIWAGVGDLDRRYPEDVRRAWRASGELEIVNARTGQKMPLGMEALDDLERHLEDYSPVRRLPGLPVPALWIHGARDATIPVEEARSVNSAVDAGARAAPWRFIVLEEGDHTFGSVHPLVAPPPPLVAALQHTQRFFEDTLT